MRFFPVIPRGPTVGTGHYPLVYDWNGDGKDEVMAGYFFLQSDGTQVWTTNTTSHPELTMHADCWPPPMSMAIRAMDTR